MAIFLTEQHFEVKPVPKKTIKTGSSKDKPKEVKPKEVNPKSLQTRLANMSTIKEIFGLWKEQGEAFDASCLARVFTVLKNRYCGAQNTRILHEHSEALEAMCKQFVRYMKEDSVTPSLALSIPHDLSKLCHRTKQTWFHLFQDLVTKDEASCTRMRAMTTFNFAKSCYEHKLGSYEFIKQLATSFLLRDSVRDSARDAKFGKYILQHKQYRQHYRQHSNDDADTADLHTQFERLLLRQPKQIQPVLSITIARCVGAPIPVTVESEEGCTCEKEVMPEEADRK
ncbi:MAG TPA: hypothetical protein VN457_00285 [Chlamydiales bacterium]|nr:hypothetical protein [Chlamydiales bacterium]